MSSQEFNEKNPPPQGPTIPPTINLNSTQVSNNSMVSAWPVREFPNIVTEDTNVNYSMNPFNFIRFNVSGSTIFNIQRVLVGSLIIAQIQGGGDVGFNVLDSLGGIMASTSMSLDAGTYFLAIFEGLIAWHNLTNPTGV